MRATSILAVALATVSLSLPACQSTHAEEERHEQQTIIVTSPLAKEATYTQQYVCQIRSRRHIEVCALQDGYLEPIPVKEGQPVKEGDVLFKVLPTLYKARMDAEVAEARLAELEYNNTLALYQKNVVSYQETALFQAKLTKARAKAALATAEMDFTEVRASFDGIINKLEKQQGSLVEKKDVLTTLSDNRVMWVYFNVPEVRYYEYMAGRVGNERKEQVRQFELPDSRVELVLANGEKFHHAPDRYITIEGQFNNETGNIPFRCDFPNPEGLLRHGQTGNIQIHRTLKNAIVIPQRATFEVLDKQYVWVVGEDHVAHRRPITILHEMEDVFVIKAGLGVNDKIILEGGRQVHEGDKVEYEFRKPEDALKNQKNDAQ